MAELRSQGDTILHGQPLRLPSPGLPGVSPGSVPETETVCTE